MQRCSETRGERARAYEDEMEAAGTFKGVKSKRDTQQKSGQPEALRYQRGAEIDEWTA